MNFATKQYDTLCFSKIHDKMFNLIILLLPHICNKCLLYCIANIHCTKDYKLCKVKKVVKSVHLYIFVCFCIVYTMKVKLIEYYESLMDCKKERVGGNFICAKWKEVLFDVALCAAGRCNWRKEDNLDRNTLGWHMKPRVWRNYGADSLFH